MDDNRMFDDLLTRDLECAALPCDVLKDLNPWTRSFRNILWGMGLSTFSIPVIGKWCCLLGLLLLYMGFRPLRQENRWFRTAWLLALWRAVWYAALILSWGTPVNPVSLSRLSEILLSLVISGLPLVGQYLCLWQGILAVCRRAGQPPQAKSAGYTAAFYAGLLALGAVWEVFSLSEVSSPVLILCELTALPALFVLLVHALWNTARAMDRAGYAITPAPVRLSGRTLIAGVFLLLLAAILACQMGFSRVSMPPAQSVQALSPAQNIQLERTRARLSTLGFPDRVLDSLPDEEVLRLDQAVQVEVTQSDHMTSSGGELAGDSVVVTRADGTCRVVHCFRWETQPNWRGLEAIVVFPCLHDLPGLEISRVSGGLLWQEGETLYAQEFHQLEQTCTPYLDSAYQILTPKEQIRAQFSLPRSGEAIRAYVAYDIQADYSHGMLNYNFYAAYGRTEFPLNYPWTMPLDGSTDTTDAFPFHQLSLPSLGRMWFTQEWNLT